MQKCVDNVSALYGKSMEKSLESGSRNIFADLLFSDFIYELILKASLSVPAGESVEVQHEKRVSGVFTTPRPRSAFVMEPNGQNQIKSNKTNQINKVK